MDSFSLCCYATLYVKDVQCDYPKTEGGALSSCNRMIEALGPRQSIWLLGILAVLGNLAVIAWRLIRRDDHPVQTCLLTNLAVSDFLMGVYLMIIAIKDLQWAGNISLTEYLLILILIIINTRPYRKSLWVGLLTNLNQSGYCLSWLVPLQSSRKHNTSNKN